MKGVVIMPNVGTYRGITIYYQEDRKRYRMWYTDNKGRKKPVYGNEKAIVKDNYDKIQEDGNLTFRERLYVYPNVENKMSVPYGATINIKNKFWDLTNCAKELDKYNKEHNIQTDR